MSTFKLSILNTNKYKIGSDTEMERERERGIERI